LAFFEKNFLNKTLKIWRFLKKNFFFK